MLNFSIKELIHSDIAIKNNIDNTPNIEQLDNLVNLIFYCLQPIRDKIKKPMIITSGFRCKKVNNLANGTINSNHLTGCAADFHIKGMTIKQIIDFILKSGIEFDELGNEYNKWVHIAYRHKNNRRKVFEKN